jgi:hypothetical protein
LGRPDARDFPRKRLAIFLLLEQGSPREPPHVHVKGRGCDAKIWLEPELSIADSYGFNSRELARILRVVSENRDLILRNWHEHFTGLRPL